MAHTAGSAYVPVAHHIIKARKDLTMLGASTMESFLSMRGAGH